MTRKSLYVAILFALTYTACFYFRIYVVDTPVGEGDASVLLTAVRQVVLWGQLYDAWGMASLVSGLLALLVGGTAVMSLWGVLTALALSNYNVDLGAIGLALGFLRLVRF